MPIPASSGRVANRHHGRDRRQAAVARSARLRIPKNGVPHISAFIPFVLGLCLPRRGSPRAWGTARATPPGNPSLVSPKRRARLEGHGPRAIVARHVSHDHGAQQVQLRRPSACRRAAPPDLARASVAALNQGTQREMPASGGGKDTRRGSTRRQAGESVGKRACGRSRASVSGKACGSPRPRAVCSGCLA